MHGWHERRAQLKVEPHVVCKSWRPEPDYWTMRTWDHACINSRDEVHVRCVESALGLGDHVVIGVVRLVALFHKRNNKCRLLSKFENPIVHLWSDCILWSSISSVTKLLLTFTSRTRQLGCCLALKRWSLVNCQSILGQSVFVLCWVVVGAVVGGGLWCVLLVWTLSPPPDPLNVALCFRLSRPISFFSFLSLSLSEGLLVEFWWCFWRPGPSNVLVWALQTCRFEFSRRSKHHQNSTNGHPERDKKSENGGGRGKKREM